MAADATLSKHVQTIVVSLATMALGWLAYSVQENNVRLAVLAEKVDHLEIKAYASVSPASNIPELPTGLPLLPVHSLPASFDRQELRRK